MSLAILFYFLCTQHVPDISISIIRSLRLCCWITTLVVLFSVRCVLEIWCSWVWVVSVLQVVLQPATRVLLTPKSNKCPTHSELRFNISFSRSYKCRFCCQFLEFSVNLQLRILCLLDRASLWQLKSKRPTWFEREGRHHEVLNYNNDKTHQHNNVYVLS